MRPEHRTAGPLARTTPAPLRLTVSLRIVLPNPDAWAVGDLDHDDRRALDPLRDTPAGARVMIDVGARRRLTACGDPAPLWVDRRSAWATSVHAARQLIDQLEARNLSPVIVDTAQGALDLTETTPANQGPAQAGLW